MLCPKCLKYHSLKEECRKIEIICQNCRHKQRTNRKILTQKCAVCGQIKWIRQNT